MPVHIRRAEQGALEEPADELRLTAGSGFRKNAFCVRTCCRLGNFKVRGGGEKPIAANEFHENACLGAGQAKLDGKALGRGVEVGGRVNDEKGGAGRSRSTLATVRFWARGMT